MRSALTYKYVNKQIIKRRGKRSKHLNSIGNLSIQLEQFQDKFCCCCLFKYNVAPKHKAIISSEAQLKSQLLFNAGKNMTV